MTPARGLVRTIRHVDAFTLMPLEGNPAAVVDGEGIDGATMQRIALNQNLSETVFLLPPQSLENDTHIRIFTPIEELPFAGHPTIAAAHILSSENIVSPREGEPMRLETGAGVIPVAIAGDPPRYTMTQATPQFRSSKYDSDTLASWLGLDPGDVIRAEDASTGIWWPIAQLASFEAMLRVRPNLQLLAGKAISAFCIGAESPEASVRVRTFFPGKGVTEDPVTGSSNGCIAAFIAKHGLMPRGEAGAIEYVAEQGIEMGQPGRVYLRVTRDGDAFVVQVGGHAVTVLRGELTLPA